MEPPTYSIEKEFTLTKLFNELFDLVERGNVEGVAAWLKKADQGEFNLHTEVFIGTMYLFLKRGVLDKFLGLGLLAAHDKHVNVLEHFFTFDLSEEGGLDV